jgi:hypothetical protein
MSKGEALMPRRQIIKSIVGTALGVAPGVTWWIISGTTQGLVLAGFGAFIGFALSLPGVSASRIAGATAGTIVAYNVPGPLKGKVLDHFMKEGDGQAVRPEDGPEGAASPHQGPDDRLM